jgi:integrase
VQVKKLKKVLGQAQTLSSDQVSAVIAFLNAHSRHSCRDICMFLLTVKAGLRAVEVANIEWSMVLDTENKQIGKYIELPKEATKGGKTDRWIPINKVLKQWLADHLVNSLPVKPNERLFYSERGYKFDRFKVVGFFWRLYKRLGFYKCSSHSGRRTFITDAARKITKAGGSLRDIQDLVGHRSLETTQSYIKINEGAKIRVVDMI